MEEKIICQNKRASHDYFIIEKYEAGIELLGTEIKSIRNNGASFIDAYCEIKNSEVYVKGLHIKEYAMGNIFNHDPDRKKKLLLHKKEIVRLNTKKTQDGYTLIPTKMYFVEGLVKIEIAICKGKKLYDKREAIKKEDQIRMIKKEDYGI